VSAEPAAEGAARTRVHLVYPHGPRTGNPDSIGRELGRRLEARYDVVYHDWFELGAIEPGPGDVIVGHPHPDPRTVLRRSIRRPGWRRRLLLAPFHYGDLRQNAFEDRMLADCDRFLAITGPYWFRTVGGSVCSHWQPKMVHLDMAIDREHFPRIKRGFNEPGRRSILYIGRKGRGKGTEYLSEIAARLPGVDCAWMGRGSEPIEGFRPLGFVDYDSEAGRELVASFDIFVTAGNADANPTTILESMGWGLIPVCTPTSGYDGIPSIPNIPLGDPDAAAAVLRRLLDAPGPELEAMQAANRELLERHYNWDRFAGQVIDAIESGESPALLPESPSRRLGFVFHELTSPYSPIKYSLPARLLGRIPRLWRKIRGRGRARSGG
jgi:glycosyltransferase involved in cell wall biosynthesis